MASLEDFRTTYDLPARTFSPRQILSPRSFLSDRVVPEVELTRLRQRTLEAQTGSLEGKAARQDRAPLSRRQRVTKFYEKPVSGPDGRYVMDMRRKAAGNWSHLINQIIPITSLCMDALSERGMDGPVVLVTSSAPKAAIALFEALGIETWVEDAGVSASFIDWHESRRGMMAEHDLGNRFTSKIRELADQCQTDFGRNIFIDRQKTRIIANGDEARSVLKDYGYTPYLMEDFSMAEQLSMIFRADRIAAIHGAGLAPLMYLPADKPVDQLLEIFSPAHVVPFFYYMVADRCRRYLGLRGIPSEGLLRHAFNLETEPKFISKNFSLEPFSVDLQSLELALDETKLAEHFGSDVL